MFELFPARKVGESKFVRVWIDCFGAKARFQGVACPGAICGSWRRCFCVLDDEVCVLVGF